jgi:hypothetical protein
VAWELAGRTVGSTENQAQPVLLDLTGPLHAVVNAIAHIHIKPPRLTKQGVVAGAAVSMPVTGGLALAIRLRCHKYAPEPFA